MCNKKEKIATEETVDANIDVNTAAVLASVSTGVGFSQLEESLSVLNVPCMSYITYAVNHSKISEKICETAWKCMEGGKEEARLARECGEIDEDGYPLITVIGDGAWCKRSN
ncbi:hypothetical protein MML48_5g00014584 [Holotrichia oblita]|uniref:Uncharacterized protein n=1 Tax=Holotrichia oblita TaxID=644536 RepID=A0ACB9T143_HOLOL|nr:hypothetical protein MML48_5g00014584 [Holotrichia oblita]